LTIQGLGAQNLTIKGGIHGRVFEVYGAQVTLAGLTITGGNPSSALGNDLFWQYYFDGGGVLNFGTLTLSSCTVTGNFALNQGNGGGIYNGGTLTLNGCTVTSNISINGAGIYNAGITDYGTYGDLTITSSTVAGNYFYGEGGGIYNQGNSTFTSSTVTGNYAGYGYGEGGGIYNTGTLTLSGSTLSNSLEHPGIVPVYGLGQYTDGRPFYAMRFIKGDNLKEAIERFHERGPTTGRARPQAVTLG